MGLTIHYNFGLNTRSTAKARQAVTQLRLRALELPMQEVGEIIDVSGEAADFQRLPREHPRRWLLIQSTWHVQNGRYSYSVPPKRVIAFSTFPGPGCEPANFGLCQFPATIEVEENGVKRRLRTGAKGWCWRSFCKTQYASNVSVEHFLRCHLSVTAMLDHAKTLGVLADVSDEGDYWQKRDVKALAEEVGQWNEMIAAGAGRLKDLIGNELEAPILAHPNFEHLEAKGRNGDAR